MQSKSFSISVSLLPDVSQKLLEISDSRVHSVAAVMLNGFQQHFNLSELAQGVNLTPEHLCRLFKRELGISPFKYLKLCRLQRACVLLETSHLSVKQIMFSVGFSDESHFVRDFENTLGLSPMRFRDLRHKELSMRCVETLNIR
jgi:transcriptional regulator GlxA family with amidase domain